MAKKSRVWDGTAWQELASAQTDLTAYSTTAQMNTAITAGVGLVPILTQTIGTAVSSVVVTNAFSSTYDNYKILISGGAASANTDIDLKLGASATGYYYGRSAIVYSSGSQSNFNGNNVSSFIGGIGKGESTGLHLVADLISPFLAKNTIVASYFIDGRTDGFAGYYAGFHNSAVSYSDLTVTSPSGTMTGGTIRVYGYKN